MCYSVMTQAYLEKEIPSSRNWSRTYDLYLFKIRWVGYEGMEGEEQGREEVEGERGEGE